MFNECKTPKLTELQIKEEVSKCLLCYDAPCSRACPAGTDPAKFIRSLRFDNPKGAMETIKINNVFGGVCGLVCPSKAYCEGACSRTGINTPIKIREIQQYLTEKERETKFSPLSMLEKPSPTGKKIGIVGSGPAGVAAACELAKLGHDVTVYERDEKLGGYLVSGIPSDRLDESIVEYEINEVKKLGVKFVAKTEIKDAQELLSKGVDAVIWATGLHKGKTVAIDGCDLKNVEIGVDYLKKVKETPNDIYCGKNVIVIGGGDVAMDVARVAKLRGADEVSILYRRTEKEMPAYCDEKAHAKELGINFFVKFKPVSINGKDKVESATFESLGNDTNMTFKCDQYIFAVSQESEFDIEKIENEKKGIFVAGDIVNDDKTVVSAVKSGKEVAAKVNDFIMK